MTSATIANPRELAEQLVEEKVEIVSKDGSPRGKKHIIFYNPPVIKPELGIRLSPISESVRLANDLLANGIQTCLFVRSRRSVEIILHSLHEQFGEYAQQIHGYRSGYLPKERRMIEKSLRSGETRLVAATNALELGIDIGTLDAVILVGYPGSVAATRQQFGRAGRRKESSLAVLVASAGPLDQFLMKHPEFILERSAEHGLINPDNLLILLQHIRCAAFELPFKSGDTYGSVSHEILGDLLYVLEKNNVVHLSGERYFWTADAYPASEISLRSVSADRVMLQYELDGRSITIGEVDKPSAAWMVHPNAIYMHEGQTYLVKTYDIEENIARLTPTNVDYFTEPKQQVTIEKLSTIKDRQVTNGRLGVGDLEVISQVVGFRKINWITREILGNEVLDLPPTTLRTRGTWLVISEKAIDYLRETGLWTNDLNNYGKNWDCQRQLARERDRFKCQVCGLEERGSAHHVHHIIPFRNFNQYIEANELSNLITLCPNCHQRAELSIRIRSGLSGLSHAIHHISTLFLMCDVADLGSLADPRSPIGEGQPTIIVYERIPSGIGLSEEMFKSYEDIINQAFQLVKECECSDGCPSCVGPGGENGIGGKRETLGILTMLCGKDHSGE